MAGVPPAVAVFEYHLTGYRRVWRGTLLSSFVLPVLLFLGIGLAVGEYVDRGGGLDLPYRQFIGAGLLAFTGVQIAMNESTFPVMNGFRWQRTYYAMAAAPPRVRDILAGQFGYVGVRIGVSALAFLLVMLPFGAVGSPWAVLAPLVTVATGLAVAAPLAAYAATVDSPNLLAVMMRFGLLPMMLFSGVFFPVDQLPAGLQPLAYLLPLFHGVELSRVAVLGPAVAAPAWPVAAHLGCLGLWLAGGCWLAARRFRGRLAS